MIWCVEDDASILDIEVYTLQSTGFQAQGFADGGAFWSALESARELPELVVLDVMLPGVDGVELLRRMRAAPATRSIPVVMATAKGAEYDKIQALDLGADYYLTKPFGVMELVSCVKAVLRRCARPAHLLHLAGLVLDQDAHTVSCDGQRVSLTYKEYELLRLLLSHPGMAFTRDQLMAQVWGTDYCGETRTVDMHIRTLRQKLGPTAVSSRPSATWATGWRNKDDQENFPFVYAVRRGRAAGGGGHRHDLPVQLFCLRAGVPAPGSAAIGSRRRGDGGHGLPE